jgi:hypothetical protein
MTGAVDVEAGTQVVRAEELKAAIPPTRVDPKAGLPKAKADAAPAREVGASPPEKKSSMVVPIAAVVVLAAAGGGMLLLRGRNGPAPAPADTTQQVSIPTTPTDSPKTQGGDPGTVIQMHAADTTTKPSGTGSVKPTGTKPPIGRDTAGQGPFPTLPKVVLPDIEDIFDAGRRDAARQKAEAIWRRKDVTDSIRAAAANMVAAAYQQDNQIADALTWANRSNDLRPSEQTQGLINRLKQLLGN